MRLLAQDPLRYRRQMLALKQFFATRACTVLLLDDKTSDPRDLQLHSISHGVISLEQAIQEYGTERRRVRVVKMRGQKFQGGCTTSSSTPGGSRCSRAWSRREHRTRRSSTSRSAPARPSSTGCSAAA